MNIRAHHWRSGEQPGKIANGLKEEGHRDKTGDALVLQTYFDLHVLLATSHFPHLRDPATRPWILAYQLVPPMAGP